MNTPSFANIIIFCKNSLCAHIYIYTHTKNFKKKFKSLTLVLSIGQWGGQYFTDLFVDKNLNPNS